MRFRRSTITASLTLAGLLGSATGAQAQTGSDLVGNWVTVAMAILLLILLGGTVVLGLFWRRSLFSRNLLLGSLNATSRARQVIDPAGRVVLANDAFDRLFEGVKAPLPQLLLGRVSAGSDAAEILRQLILTVAEGGRGRTEIEIPQGDGTIDWFDVSGRSIVGFPGYVLWGAERVTAQRQIEDFIRSDHEKFADLIEHAPIGFYSVDETGRFLFVNSTLTGWLGLEPDNEGGYRERLHDLVPDQMAVAPAYSPFRDAQARSGEVVLRGPNGRTFQAFIRHDIATVQSPDGSGLKLRTRSVVHDLSRERELESALQVSEQYFQRFFEEAPASILLLDEKGRVEQANPAFQHLLIGAEWAQIWCSPRSGRRPRRIWHR